MIKYIRGRRRHTLKEVYTINTGLETKGFQSEKITLHTNGLLTLAQGFEWNGATGIVDAKCFMRGSAVHDALYELIKQGVLNKSHRKQCDKLMRRIFHEDGTPWILSQLAYFGVRLVGRYFSK